MDWARVINNFFFAFFVCVCGCGCVGGGVSGGYSK